MNTGIPGHSKRPHIALFSQTGTEIVELIIKYQIIPDLILTNVQANDSQKINPYLQGKVVTTSRRPDVAEYRKYFNRFDNPVITLHGWLRIVPEEICNQYEIYNGHPGLITADSVKDSSGIPILRGKDPQLKAYNLGLDTTGSVIHRVTSGVDEGEIMISKKIWIKELPLDEIFTNLRECSLEIWSIFLQSVLKHE